MRKTFIYYSIDTIAAILLGEPLPISESLLIRKLSVEYDYPSLRESDLYTIHFSLFYALYQLKCSEKYRHYYTHIYTSAIKMTAFPEREFCAHYNQKYGQFCLSPAVSEVGYCIKHHKHCPNRDMPIHAVMSHFYRDKDNISFGDLFDLKGGMQKVLLYGFCKKEVDDALLFFDLDISLVDNIHDRYKKLAREHHPDWGGSSTVMKSVNAHYDLLKKIFC